MRIARFGGRPLLETFDGVSFVRILWCSLGVSLAGSGWWLTGFSHLMLLSLNDGWNMSVCTRLASVRFVRFEYGKEFCLSFIGEMTQYNQNGIILNKFELSQFETSSAEYVHRFERNSVYFGKHFWQKQSFQIFAVCVFLFLRHSIKGDIKSFDAQMLARKMTSLINKSADWSPPSYNKKATSTFPQIFCTH